MTASRLFAIMGGVALSVGLFAALRGRAEQKHLIKNTTQLGQGDAVGANVRDRYAALSDNAAFALILNYGRQGKHPDPVHDAEYRDLIEDQYRRFCRALKGGQRQVLISGVTQNKSSIGSVRTSDVARPALAVPSRDRGVAFRRAVA